MRWETIRWRCDICGGDVLSEKLPLDWFEASGYTTQGGRVVHFTRHVCDKHGLAPLIEPKP